MKNCVPDGSTSQPINGTHIVAMAAVIPLTICTFDLFNAEWNSDRYDATAEKGPVNLITTYIKLHKKISCRNIVILTAKLFPND